MEDSAQAIDPGAKTAAPEILTGPGWNEAWHALSRPARHEVLRAAGRQWFDWWRMAVDLESVPPTAWGWRPSDGDAPLAMPAGLMRRRPTPLATHEVLASMAAWLFGDHPSLDDAERIRFVDAFARAGGLGDDARHSLRRRLFRAADTLAVRRARDVAREVSAEMMHQCRQTVACRGIWLPDPSLSADEFRQMIEGTFRARGAHETGTGHAEEAPALLNREEVAIRRYRHPRTSLVSGTGRFASPARRDWITCMTLIRLGIPVPQPVGLLEILNRGRIIDCYVVVRMARNPVASHAPARPGGMRELHAAWLRLLDRSIGHGVAMIPQQSGGLDEQSVMAACWSQLDRLYIGCQTLPLGWFFALRRLRRTAGHLLTARDRLQFLAFLAGRWPWLRRPWVRSLIGARSPS